MAKVGLKMMRNEEILKGLKEFGRDVYWLSENQEKLRKKFHGKYVAVINCEVVDSDPNLQILLQRLREGGKNPGEIPVEFISREPARLILSAMEIPSCAS